MPLRRGRLYPFNYGDPRVEILAEMSIEEHLSDLKSTFPGAKVLYAPDIAIALNKSPTAIRRMLDKRQIPELKTYGGRLGVSLVNFAKFLEEGDSDDLSQRESSPFPQRKRVAPTTREVPRLRDLMALATRQVEFWSELHASLEAISLRDGQGNEERNVDAL